MRRLILAIAMLGFGTGCAREQSRSGAVSLPSSYRGANLDYASGEPSGVEDYRTTIAPYVQQSRLTYPEAKRRFLQGLPPNQAFYAATMVQDDTGTTEQIFVAVSSINNGLITGQIVTRVVGVSGRHRGEIYTFSESDLVDWVISHSGGAEEGHFVGRFLKSLFGTGAKER